MDPGKTQREQAPDGARRKKRARSLEFDFIMGGGTRPKTKTAPPERAARKEEPIVHPLTPRPLPEPEDTPFETFHEANRKEPMKIEEAPQPSVVRASHNLDRQRKEQNAVNTLLQGVGLTLLSIILFTAALATLGGYVLWKQIQDQSASLALLESNTKDRLSSLGEELRTADNEIILGQEQASMNLLKLQAQFEQYRSDSQKQLADLKASNDSLEKSISYYRTRLNEQQQTITQLQAKARR